MEIRGQQPQASIEQYCIEHGVMIATTWYYRLSLLVSLAISATAAFYMTYFLHRHSKHSPFFHSNLKVLFFALSISCLSYDLVNVVMKAFMRDIFQQMRAYDKI
ncbi:hypothetical protein GCK32_006794 [Trichostrongylus colubriformis]|uniref:Uncharacterized protein n=1 Tax=Trichostrongylus colubriformis TaxID=6319 RepID=A0AAN8F7R0_TRICO